ncbi:MAG TPA: hypothetical protein PK079_21085 [Leptospiraceae bacterium]|nr:hypothetical protein [Leptospiraceae bacterium]HMW07187.1 hypothetical protein [Leptospiraceae bacterium]HMX33780.1 hypothetical protein [Leptospiraceae bacterium]HMY32803.1 hypothetical protein [Leptospiraceae bacterium]HMZ67101.1 hypothetical protein [Leptospiraceae bacterium]
MHIQNRLTNNFFFFLILFTFFFACNVLLAESIRLTSGQILEGKIVEESEKILVLQTNKGTFTIKKTDILEMERPGSKETITKAPEDKKLSKLNIALLSFIPGYSPTYNSKERPEIGIPFAMANLFYFYHFLQFQFNSNTLSFQESSEMRNPILALYNYVALPGYTANQLGIGNPQNSNFFGSYQYLQGAYVYFQIRDIFYLKNKDRVVEGRQMTEEEYLNEKRCYLESYAIASIVNGLVAYFLLSSENNIGALYKTEHNGIRTVFYAVPTPNGASFGAASRF